MNPPIGTETMSMLVELDPHEITPLWTDLFRFKKGTKRVQRLKLLAFQGLLWERGVTGLQAQVAGIATVENASVARGIFDAPLED